MKELGSTKFTNLYNCWRMVLDLILEDHGGKWLIDAKRGKLFRAPSSEVKDLREEEIERAPADEENIPPEEVDEINLELA